MKEASSKEEILEFLERERSPMYHRISKRVGMNNLVRVTVRDFFGRKHHGRNMKASNHQGMAKHYNYCDSEYF